MNISINSLRECVNEFAAGKWTVFATNAGLVQNTFKGWLDGISQPTRKNLHKLLLYTGKPESFFYPDEKPYPETPQHMLPPDHVKTADSKYGIPGRSDTEKHRVTRLIEPDNQWYVNAVTEVLNSNEPAVSEALKANIRQFREQVEDKKQIRKMQDEINALKTEVKRAANFECGPAEPADDVEEGGGQ